MKGKNRYIAILMTLCVFLPLLSGCREGREVLTLKVANWEEYIDEGGWDEDEVIELEDGTTILGEDSLVDEFEDWYYVTRGKRIKVEYSTYGTNEDLYNQITLGDVYDLMCPSDYMIMKLMREDRLEEYDASFMDTENPENYYATGVSPYIESLFEELDSGGKDLSKYAAGYMWGNMGFVYNPELVSEEDVSRWDFLLNDKYKRRITIKDSVRDTYFAALEILYRDEILGEALPEGNVNPAKLKEILNRHDDESIEGVQDILTRARGNVYSFETDAGKADMITGKVAANMQWSGDGAYVIEQAADDDVLLSYTVPEEGTNVWFDGWVMMKDGVGGDPEKKEAAQSFVNFLSRPENAIRNMYYIGYTSVISGGDSNLIFEYTDWYNGAGEDAEVTEDYPLGYFFGGDDEDYTVIVDPDSVEGHVMKARYPTREVMERSAVMDCFDDESNEKINRMWTNVRCFDLKSLWERK